MKLSDIKTEFEKYMVIKDPYVLNSIFGTLVGNLLIPRDPLWLLLIASSSGGKSTFMAPCVSIPNIFFIDDLTENTFLSGYKVGKTEVSFLKIMGNGVMCVSDFTVVLSKDKVSRGEILSQLRLVHDGTFIKRTGNGEIRWSGKLGFLGASTPDVYFQLENSRSMGERFLYLIVDQPTDQEIVEKQESVNMSSREITEIMKPMFKEYFSELRDFTVQNGIPPLNMTPEQVSRVHKASILCVMGKASVYTDFKTGKPASIPNKPGVGRDRKMFNTMLHAQQIMHAFETDDINATVQENHIRMIEKCAYSSINRERRKCLEILAVADRPLSSSIIGATDNFGLGKEAVEKYIYPLFAVGIIQRVKVGSAFKWKIDDEMKEFIKDVAERVPKEIPKDEDEVAEDAFNNW